MKLSNIFKKGTKTVAKANVEKMDKKQLEKVIGGADTKSGSALNQGASLLGGALPGGAIISA